MTDHSSQGIFHFRHKAVVEYIEEQNDYDPSFLTVLSKQKHYIFAFVLKVTGIAGFCTLSHMIYCISTWIKTILSRLKFWNLIDIFINVGMIPYFLPENLISKQLKTCSWLLFLKCSGNFNTDFPMFLFLILC